MHVLSTHVGTGTRLACLLTWVVALTVTACEDRASEPASRPDTTPSPDATATVDAASGESELARKRSAFGLPLPPRVLDVRRFSNTVEVDTPMSIEKLDEFFRTRLVDYEILHPSGKESSIRIVGLRPFMPAIRGHAHGSVVYLTYAPARQKPKPSSLDAGTEGADTRAPTSPSDETASDDESRSLAPGAEPGEPYTPPPGSPLHRPRYRSNFGKPFGEWDLP